MVALVSVAVAGGFGPGSRADAALAFPSIAVPAGARVAVRLTQTLSSQREHVGGTFGFVTTRDETLGATRLSAGTPGHGRIAIVSAAHDHVPGALSLQADSLDLPDGRTIAVNVDPTRPLRGRFADVKTHVALLPILFGIVRTTRSGDLVLDAGTRFDVITTTPRSVPTPLLTATPTPLPATLPATSARP